MRLLIIILTMSAFIAGYIASELGIFAKADYERNLKVIEAEVTAYSPSPNQTQGDSFQMASGRIAIPSELEQLMFVAASRDLISKYNLKWGDTVWIGFNLQDTMAVKVANHLDLFMRSIKDARKFGRQSRTIIIERR